MYEYTYGVHTFILTSTCSLSFVEITGRYAMIFANINCAYSTCILSRREDEFEKLNRQALKIAREVADKTGALMAANICNTTIFTPDRPDLVERCRALFTVSFESVHVFSCIVLYKLISFCKI